ncbi:MAG: ribosome recycling factor [Candidatus Pacebacteria bacterium]|nr:ribosome recycling factor [Candidatus Paceibacterota bacterium]
MNEIIQRQKQEFEKIIQRLKERIQKIRTGRATPALVEDLIVDYYGTKVKLKQIAAILCPEPREILIQPWDKNTIEAIEKALMQADLGTSPIVEKENIRIKLPPLTEEFRKNLVAKLGKEKEEAREGVRRSRDEILRKITKLFEEKEISEDEKFRLKEKIQEVVDEYNQKIEEIIQQKTKEIIES